MLGWSGEQEAAIRPVAGEGATIPHPLAAKLEPLANSPAARLERVGDLEKLFGWWVGWFSRKPLPPRSPAFVGSAATACKPPPSPDRRTAVESSCLHTFYTLSAQNPPP